MCGYVFLLVRSSPPFDFDSRSDAHVPRGVLRHLGLRGQLEVLVGLLGHRGADARVCEMANRSHQERMQGHRVPQGEKTVHSENSAMASVRQASLVMLVLQNYLQFILMRFARASTLPEDQYSSAAAVICQELIKTVLSFAAVIAWEAGSLKGAVRHLYQSTVIDRLDFLKLAVPGLLYTIQNNLVYVSVTHLDAATAQILYQLKILTTAVFSVIMLGRRLSVFQWLSLSLLALGAALVQMSAIQFENDSKQPPAVVDLEKRNGPAEPLKPRGPFGIPHEWIGASAVLLAVVLSGFAGVYFERVLKRTKMGVWTRNVQLGLFGLVFGSGSLIFQSHQWNRVMSLGFFHGFSPLAWAVILDVSAGGLLTAIVVKYADNIAKGFATSISILLSALTTAVFLWTVPTLKFVMGATMVLTATVGFTYFSSSGPPPSGKTSPTAGPTQTTEGEADMAGGRAPRLASVELPASQRRAAVQRAAGDVASARNGWAQEENDPHVA